jgi:hypothetical protein
LAFLAAGFFGFGLALAAGFLAFAALAGFDALDADLGAGAGVALALAAGTAGETLGARPRMEPGGVT